MSPLELTSRVMWESGGIVAALSFLSGVVGGLPAAAGVGAGGALAIANFRWLAGSVVGALDGSPAPSGWALGFGLRLTALAAATAAILASGWAHPLGLVAGLTVLPCALVRQGYAQARALTRQDYTPARARS